MKGKKIQVMKKEEQMMNKKKGRIRKKEKGKKKKKKKEKEKGIVAKALDGQRYPLPLCVCKWV